MMSARIFIRWAKWWEPALVQESALVQRKDADAGAVFVEDDDSSFEKDGVMLMQRGDHLRGKAGGRDIMRAGLKNARFS